MTAAVRFTLTINEDILLRGITRNKPRKRFTVSQNESKKHDEALFSLLQSSPALLDTEQQESGLECSHSWQDQSRAVFEKSMTSSRC